MRPLQSLAPPGIEYLYFFSSGSFVAFIQHCSNLVKYLHMQIRICTFPFITQSVLHQTLFTSKIKEMFIGHVTNIDRRLNQRINVEIKDLQAYLRKIKENQSIIYRPTHILYGVSHIHFQMTTTAISAMDRCEPSSLITCNCHTPPITGLTKWGRLFLQSYHESCVTDPVLCCQLHPLFNAIQ